MNMYLIFIYEVIRSWFHGSWWIHGFEKYRSSKSSSDSKIGRGLTWPIFFAW